MTIQKLFEKLTGVLTKVVPPVKVEPLLEEKEEAKASDNLLPVQPETKEEGEVYHYLPDLTEFFEQCYSIKGLEFLVSHLDTLEEETADLKKALKPFVIFFANRWERIKYSRGVYLAFDGSCYAINNACVQMAEIIAPILEVPVYQLLMPGVRVADNTIPLHRLLLSDDKTRAISVMGYFDRAVVETDYPQTDEFGKEITFNEHQRLQNYFYTVGEYKRTVDDLIKFKKDKTAPVPIKCYVTELVACTKREEKEVDWFYAVFDGLTPKERSHLEWLTCPDLKASECKTFHQLFRNYRGLCGQSNTFLYLGNDEEPGGFIPTGQCLDRLMRYNSHTLFDMKIKVEDPKLIDRTEHCLRSETFLWKEKVKNEVPYVAQRRYEVLNETYLTDNTHEFSQRVFTEEVLDFLMVVVGNDEIAALDKMYRKYLNILLHNPNGHILGRQVYGEQVPRFAQGLFNLLRYIPEDKRLVVIDWLNILPLLKIYGLCPILQAIDAEKREEFMRLLGRPVLWTVFSNKQLFEPALMMLTPEGRKSFFEWLGLELTLWMDPEETKKFLCFMNNVFPRREDRVALVLKKLPRKKEVLFCMLEFLDKDDQAMILEKLTDKQLKKMLVGKDSLKDFGAKVLHDLHFGLGVKINKSHLQCYMRAYRGHLQEVIDQARSVAKPSFFKENAKLSPEYQEEIVRIQVRINEANHAMSAVSTLLAEMEGVFVGGEFRKYMQNNLSHHFNYLKEIYDFYERLCPPVRPQEHSQILAS